ncbi:glycosyltransferase [Cryobacterium sp. PH31-L1]|uniref:glycosyltransferase n=1 Tax=Cryobacterium sp. PH31-L1 TaxID=3046199 RepID=UPI0024BBE509|nr:glycosyltransferase [Cryobacterium sp. PH31-L1]MDJ0377744.1 glycosyltransferase [Cryobacterium sp. PH31-L1]
MFPLEKPLRIALVCLHTSPGTDPGSGDAGGMNVVVRHQAEALGALGHSVTILTRRSSPVQPLLEYLAPGVILQFLDAGPAVALAKGEHERYIEDFEAAIGALEPFDIIHSHHWFSGMAALPVARTWDIPHVQSFHSIAAEDGSPLAAGERAESPGRMLGEAWLARESDSMVAISAAEAATISGRLDGRADRTSIVLPGVDSQLFSPARLRQPPAGSTAAATAAATADGYVVVAARLQPLKGLDLAIHAIAALPQGRRPELVIAGDASVDYAGYVEELRQLAEEAGLSDIRFVGAQSHAKLAELFRGARLVLVPSHSETYGLVALEAAASGVPVVASAAGGLREAVVDGITGLVLDSRDPQVWADAMAQILSDPTRAGELAQAAREHALRLDWTRSAASLVRVYRALLDDPIKARRHDHAVA